MIIKALEVLLLSSITGNKLKVSLFGESHGEGIGVVIDGLPPGIKLDLDYIDIQMERRAPGKSDFTSARREKDTYKILSGFFENKTTGTPLCAVIFNEDIKSEDYSELKNKMRPGHSDYSGHVKYQGYNDYRGGGHFSGRLTAPLLFAGSIALQLLEDKGIYIGSRIKSIYNIKDETTFDLSVNEIQTLKSMNFPVISKDKLSQMQQAITSAKNKGNSLGGVVETHIINIPSGYGEPFFDSVESRLSHIIFSIPAVKGIEFGAGFKITELTGSEANDEFYVKNNKIVTKTNNNGGLLGGITNGMPIIFNTAIKPTASVSILQDTVDISNMKNTTLNITGRHDPCIVPRVIPVIEGAAALAMLDLILERNGELWT
jgi:chorismate synthase